MKSKLDKFKKLFLKFIHNNTISIKCLVNVKDNDIIKKNNIVSVNLDSCRIIDDYGFLYYLEYYGEKINNDEIKHLNLLEGLK